MCNYRHPGPRRGEPRVGSAPDVPFPVDPLDPLDPVDPLQNSVRLIFTVKIKFFTDFLGKMITNFWVKLLGALLGAKMAPDAIWTACLLEPMLAPRWPKWRQDGPSWD